VNFGGLPRDPLRLGVPRPGQWQVVLDTSGYDEYGTASQAGVVLDAQQGHVDGQPYYVDVRVAALSAVYLVPLDTAGQAAVQAAAAGHAQIQATSEPSMTGNRR
jgi:1,4-alpha-glucan branching enzyme